MVTGTALATTPASGGSTHSDTCPSAIVCRGGMRSRHCGSTCGHRGANAHPGGSRTRLGGWPGIGTKAAAPGTVLGTHSSSARVYGWWAAANTSVALARSTMRPAYIVSTRSATSAITPRSWVTSTMAVP